MLDALKDHGNLDGRSFLSRKERSREAIVIKTDHVCNQMVYKLVKVRDDGSVLAATEDEVFQSLVGGPKDELTSYNLKVGGDGIGEEEDDVGSANPTLDGEDLSSIGRAKSNFAVKRQRLNAQIEVLDCILMRVDLEEKKRLTAKKEVEKVGNPSSTYVNISGDGLGEYKRQRRPNPKYFDAIFDAGDLNLTMIKPPSMDTVQPIPIRQAMSSSRKAAPRPTSDVINSPRRLTSGWGLAQHRPRSPSLKTFTQIPSKVQDNTFVSSLDNLSIRELHKAFSSTYGRETSVKDKQWLKRQISAGWPRHEQGHVGQFIKSSATITTTTTLDHQNKLKARLDSFVTQQAKQPLQTTTTLVTPTLNQRNEVANDDQGANDHIEHNFSDHAFRSRLGNRCFQRRVTTPAIVSTSCIYGEVVNNVVEGKRQRKPNRRYIEDETYVVSRFVPVHETRSFFYGKTHELQNSTTNYSWRTLDTERSLNIIGRHHASAPPGSQKFSPIQQSKIISRKMKRKVGSRAAKIVKMAHTTIAHTPRHDDADAMVHKDKLIHLLATRDIISKLDPPKMEESTNVVQPGFMLNNMLKSCGDQTTSTEGQQVVVMTTTISTVPTASGGTRRKHHRPWTLREVMTLVEGVARCGGGKWADIKKLAFSTVAYRTAVDLKDKWRNLLRASRAQLHPAKQGERKKPFPAAIPAPILSRVRELASLPNQIPPATGSSVGSTSRSGRSVHRK